MGGLLILALVAGYLWLIYQITKRVPRWVKPLVVIVAFLVVSTDGYLGRKKLEKMCEEQGGLHIYETVEGVEGIGIGDWIPTEYWLTEKGYHFVEGNIKTSGLVDRLTIQGNGIITKEINVNQISSYKFKYESINNYPEKYFFTDNTMIVNQGDFILVKATIIGYYGGWIERFIGGIYANKMTVALCPKSDSYNLMFWKANIDRFLKPKKKEK